MSGSDISTILTPAPNPMNSAHALAAAALASLLLPVAHAQQVAPLTPKHRYRFDTAAGPLSAGSPIFDSVGAAHGTVRGAGATATGSSVRIPGGSSATAAYIDLPNGVASGTDQSPAGYGTVTYETWVTVHSNQNWGRVLDFGTNSSGEIAGPGGSFTGNNYFMLTASEGTVPNIKMERFPGGIQTVRHATDVGSRMHLATTYDNGSWKFYKNGILLKTQAGSAPSTIPDVNVWLGRSNWSADSNADITYEEFRIYGQALTHQQVWESCRAGPDALPGVTPVPYQILVDPWPAQTAGAGNFAAEWNTNGNLEGWTGTQTSATVSGGLLSGTTNAGDSGVSRSNFTGGPDLDLGWNDFVELRIQVPASYNGAIQIFFGTTYNPGYATERSLTIPSSMISKDGAMHTYRIDAGQAPWWRSTLRDLRIDPVDGAGSSGLNFAIDYIRVGDEPNALVYNKIVTSEMPANGGATPSGALLGGRQTVYTMESKHFVFHWNDAVTQDGGWTADMPHGTLRNAEETWQVHARRMGYLEPCYTNEDRIGENGTSRGKINISSWHDGYWCGTDWDGTANRIRFNARPSGLRVDPPSWVISHELMHAFQWVNNAGGVPGEWQESHANYGRERWLEHFQFTYPNTSSFDPAGVKNAHLIVGDGRDQYLRWTPFLYLDSNPDNLPDLGEGTVAMLYRSSAGADNPFNVLDTIAPLTGKKKAFGGFAQRGATLNYPTRPMLRYYGANDWALTRFQFTDLEQRPDDPTWWRLPYYMAPQQGGYVVHELVVPNPGTAGRVVTVNFRGLPDSGRGADWRGGFTVLADDGGERYTAPAGNGTHTVTLGANENRLFFCVAGAPDLFASTNADETICSYRSHPGKTRFPYELQVAGAAPKQRDGGATNGLVQHPNGGGWKSPDANVAPTAFIGPNARVRDFATVGANARVEDYAVVQNNAQVLDNAIVGGYAWIRDNATIRDNAKVRDWATVFGNATLLGNARALEHCEISGNTQVENTAVVKGSAWATDGRIHGNAIVDGNYWCWREISNGFVTGHQPFVGVPDTFITPLPKGLYAHYGFTNAHDSRVIDSYGVSDSFTIGSPSWVGSDAGRSGLLSLNGSTQFINLDRNLADQRDFTFACWVKPAATTANQALLWMGSSTTKRLYLTPNDGAGRAKFAIVDGGAEQVLLSPSALPVGAWSHVAFTLDGTTGVLYVNGTPVATGSISVRADQMLAANTATALAHNYLGRSEGAVMAKYHGLLDDAGFYSSVLTPADIAGLASVNPALATPTGLAAAAGAAQIRLNWNAAANAVSYNVKRSTASGGPYTILANAPSPHYTDTTAVGGTTYYYVVSSVNGASQSADSSQASATPTTSVKATGIVIGSAGSWGGTGNTIAKVFDGDLASYYDAVNASGDWAGLDLGAAQTITQVKYCPRSGMAGRMVGGVFQGSNTADFSGATVTLFTVTATPPEGAMTTQTITNADTYRYVRYVGPANSYCNIAEAEFYKASSTTAIPSAPTGLSATASSTQIALSWTGGTGAASYNVKRSAASGGPYSTIASVGATSYADTGLPGGTTYYYVVSAVNSSGESANSNQAAATTFSAPPAPWTGADIGSVGVSGQSGYASGTFTVSGSGDDIWNTQDAFRYVSQSLTGDGEIRARVTSQTNTDPWAKAGVMIRDGSAAGAVNALVALTPNNGFTFQSRATASGSCISTAGPALNAAPNNWVRLVRSGSLFTAYVSGTGTAWTQVGTVTLSMGSTVSAGLAVTSHNNTTASTAAFDNVTVTPFPSPWLGADIGAAGLVGSAEFFADAYTLKGAGAFGGSTDSFRYVYQTLSGDGSIVARVGTLNNTGTSARVGIMIRDTLANNSRMAALSVTGTGAFKWERRTTTGGTVTNTNSSSGTAPNIWIRLTRAGNTITAAKSTNGTSWTSINSATITMASNCYVGLAVASGSTSTLNTSVFTNVNATP